MENIKVLPPVWSCEAEALNSIVIVDEQQNEIASVSASNDEDLLTDIEWENARLISAAPQLFEALLKARSALMDAHGIFGGGHAVNFVFDEINRAIDKAVIKNNEN